ncbi:MAG: ATP-binding protein [Elusimicrobia bacterium]|nr:ATP-binding protein [Elusimicrobiota bacterium]
MYPRNLEPALLEALLDSPVVFLNGARQTGKSTLAQGIAKGSRPARYLTFDDVEVMSAAKGDPRGFLSGLDGPVILDEVQRVPELFLPLKAEVDRNRKPGRFLLTGSANAMVLPRLSDALTGRMEVLTLWPLSQGEIDRHREGLIDLLFDPEAKLPVVGALSRDALWERVARGGYPEPMSRVQPERRRAWVNSYITTLIERDVRDLSDIEDRTQLPRLLSLLAARTASLLNYAELSRSLGIPQSTLKRYLALLEATFLVHRVPPWSGNLGKRLVKAPKVFLIDTGLATSLLGADAERLAGDGMLSGPLLENFVMAELAKQSWWSRIKPRMHHMRAQTGSEVDFVLEDARGRCVGIEVKAGSVGIGELKGLKAFAEVLGKRFVRGIVLYAGRETIPFAKNLHALPINALWVGRD